MSQLPLAIRNPAVAGRFYDADPRKCAVEAHRLCRVEREPELPPTLYGAMVPHAGWICSGRIAGRTLATLARRTLARTLILTGSVHTTHLLGPALDGSDCWRTPVGDVQVDHDLRQAMARLPDFGVLDEAHVHEHSLEVQLPLLIETFGPGVKILPVMIGPDERAVQWGRSIGRLMRRWPSPLVMVASSDLTHYGPNFRFTPAGGGEAGRKWATEINDARLLEMILKMQADRIVAETESHHSACGGGAIAAMLAACSELGATRGHLLEHTDSTAVLAPLGRGDPNHSVGYAGVVFG